jgi:iron(III) transport system substrate-binding protein
MRTILLTLALCALGLGGCGEANSSSPQVVLYTSVDEPIARPIIQQFEKTSGIRVRLVTDAEATKSVGLAEKVRAEKANPQADVFWGNEPFHTINLAEEGLLAPYEAAAAKEIPPQFKDPQQRWAGNGLRARVIAVSGRLSVRPEGLDDLTQPAWKGKIVMASPSAGTTGGHVAAIYVLRGDDGARDFFKKLHANGIKLVGGNSVSAQQVAQNNFAAGLTDNDDVANAKVDLPALDSVLPDQDGDGTLMVPTTVGLVAGGKNAEAGKKLTEYLLSAVVEKKLIDAKFALVSVRELEKNNVKAMKVDYREVARALPRAVREATAILEGRE